MQSSFHFWHYKLYFFLRRKYFKIESFFVSSNRIISQYRGDQSKVTTMSYDPKVFELGWEFILAGERYRILDMDRVPAEDQFEMCGLFKQATFGDIDIKFSGAQGHVLRNCQAWQSNRGLSKPDAIRRYVTKSDQLVSVYKS